MPSKESLTELEKEAEEEEQQALQQSIGELFVFFLLCLVRKQLAKRLTTLGERASEHKSGTRDRPVGLDTASGTSVETWDISGFSFLGLRIRGTSKAPSVSIVLCVR